MPPNWAPDNYPGDHVLTDGLPAANGTPQADARCTCGSGWAAGFCHHCDRPAPVGSDPAGFTLELIDSATFDSSQYKQHWHIKRIMTAEEPGIWGASKKTLKTGMAVEAGVSLATGCPFLGEWEVVEAVPVCILSGESGKATLQNLARRVCWSKGKNLKDLPIYWGFNLPQLSNPEHVALLAAALKKYGVKVLFYDPLYLGLLAGSGAEGLSASNLYQMGPLLLTIARACLGVGCTPILIHHFKLGRKDHFAEPQLEDLAFSGVQEFARQWLLLGRRSHYDPEDEDGRAPALTVGRRQRWTQHSASCGRLRGQVAGRFQRPALGGRSHAANGCQAREG